MTIKTISEYILEDKRRYKMFNTFVKNPLQDFINKAAELHSLYPSDFMLPFVLLMKLYPDSTKLELKQYNSSILRDISKDFFLEGLDNGQEELWKGVWNLLICELEHDSFYGQRVEWVVHKLLKADQVNCATLESIKNAYLFYESPKHGHKRLFVSIWFLISKLCSDYEKELKWVVERIRESNWKPLVETRPSRDGWSEPIGVR